jgi:hypothetical protein
VVTSQCNTFDAMSGTMLPIVSLNDDLSSDWDELASMLDSVVQLRKSSCGFSYVHITMGALSEMSIS